MAAERRVASGRIFCCEDGQEEGHAVGDSAREAETQRPFSHVTVLRDEVVHFMAVREDSLILDATLGGGGHSEGLLERGAMVVGVDQDEEALQAAQGRLSCFGDKFLTMQANFRDMGSILDETGVQFDGVVLNLGVSSWQLDSPERGFSFRFDAPLDLRMDRSGGSTAAEFLAEAGEAELADVFWKYGEERASRRIARALVTDRKKAPILTTFDLATLVERVVARRGRIHPATKVFQALRIYINDELGALEDALEWIPRHLKPGGRVAIISFHSLEDVLVKRWVRRLSREWIDRPEWPEPRRNPEYVFRDLFRKSLVPSREEIADNPRSRSARLRVAERRADE